MQTYEITFNEKTKKGKEIFDLLQQHKVQLKLKKSAKMTEKEFDAMLEESREQYKRGEFTRMMPNETFEDFLKRV